jgi:cobalt-zinc-cadmium efflux system outer membrane protein
MKLDRNVLWLLLLAGLAGCQNPMHDRVLKGLEAEYQELAAARSELDSSGKWVMAQPAYSAQATLTNPIQLASALQPGDKQPPQKQPKVILKIPPELPGSDHPGFKLPKDKKELEKYLQTIYPPLPPLEEDLPLAPGPEGRPLTLEDLQRLATEYSPVIRAAEAAVEAARGALRQSMAYPNPTFAFQNDTLATGPAGYPGFSIDQVIKTGNKLQLQGAAASMDLFIVQLALRRARTDVAYQVRSGYFAVVVARENVRFSRVFADFTDQIYANQVNLLKGNEAAAYEPMQLRPLALQARFNLIQALNQYRASWRQLAANLGLPDMPPSEVAGRVDLPVPEYDYQAVLNQVLSRHTDVLTAKNNVHKAEYLLKLAQVTPIPDVEVMVLLQKDYTTPPFYAAPSIHVNVPVPVWDRNRGAIQQAQGLLRQALQNLSVTRNSLIVTLADAHNRYVTSKKQVAITLEQLKDQVRVYKHVYDRFRGGDPAVTFGDVVTAQQTLAGYLTGYIAALGLQWTAVVDVANLLQTDDLFQGATGAEDQDLPPLEQLESLLHDPSPASASAAQARILAPVDLGSR